MSETRPAPAPATQTATRTAARTAARPLLIGLIVAVVVLALLAAYLIGSASDDGRAAAAGAPPAPAASAASAVAGEHTLTMTGAGSARAVPDEAAFTVSVALVRPDLDAAFAAANATLARVYAALEGAGVERRDVQTAGLSTSPVYDYHAEGPPTLRGYRVGQRAGVVVRDLADAGRALTAAVAAGGDDVGLSGLHLQVGDPDAALARAREDAVAQARAKAEQYAAATGRTLGDVLTLREVHGRAPRPQPLLVNGRAASLDGAAAVPIRAGREETTVRVQVVWEFGADGR